MLYKELAKYYDYLYEWKDYATEIKRVKELIKQYKKTDGNHLLEVACGTGYHVKHLKDDYKCTGLDINDEILEIARKNVPDAEFIQSDMINLELGRKFDVITSFFSSIGYVKTYSNLEKTLDGFSRHLYSGGVAIIEPWFTKDVYDVGRPSITTYEDDDLKIARVSVSEINGNVSVMDMHYLIAERGKSVKHFVDRHELGLFEVEKTLDIMSKVGFKAEYLPDGLMEKRGLFIGIKD
jgi:ubiquinone/menaquinone biosynthesis C-methylase UbiE